MSDHNPHFPTSQKEIPLTRGQVAIVDAADYEWLSQFKWYAVAPNGKHKDGKFYAVRHVFRDDGKRTLLKMHREILGAEPGVDVDHVDGNTLNNQRDNLRLCNRQQNTFNSRGQKNSVSKYKGVSWHKHTRKWFAQIGVNGKNIFLGYYDTPEEAARARDTASLKYQGEFAYLNFGDQAE